MANENKNLTLFNERTEEEQREIARQGGIASGKARREKQKTQQILADINTGRGTHGKQTTNCSFGRKEYKVKEQENEK